MKNTNVQPILQVKNLKQYFKTGVGRNKLIVRAVDDVSFDVFPGEVFSLVGESGCGKTTTGRTIIKLYKPTAGDVYFKGVRISAGNQDLKDTIKQIRLETRKLVKDCNDKIKGKNNLPSDKMAELKAKIQQIKEKAEKDVAKAPNKAAIKAIRLEAKNQIASIEAQLNERVIPAPEVISELQFKIEDAKTKASEEISRLKTDMVQRDRETDNPDMELMRDMQMIFQDPIESLNPRMTVKEIIAEGLRIAGEKNNDVIQQKVHQVLETVGLLPEHASRYPHEFSGGQRQRIGIARALVVNPDFIIADEPISALDVSIQAQVINLLNDLRQELNLTIMFIAHDLSVVKYFSDRIGVMYYGKLVEMAPKDELFKNPFHPYTKSLLSAVPVPDPQFEKNRPPRIKYDPSSHQYTKDDLPVLREITKGHFVLSNEKEFKQYQKDLKV